MSDTTLRLAEPFSRPPQGRAALHSDRGGRAATKRLTITFDGPDVEKQGVPVECLTTTLKGIQESLHRLAGHLAGCGAGPEPAPPLIRAQSALRITNVRPGSLVVEAALAERPLLDDHGQRALEALLDWDGAEDSQLPRGVTDPLRRIQERLPPDLRVFMGGGGRDTRQVELARLERNPQSRGEQEEAVLEGWLKEVNWKEKTAQLHRSEGRHVVLRFEPTLDEEMRKLANQYVGVVGSGRLGQGDQWGRVAVHEIKLTRPADPFDLERFLADPNPRPFEPDRLVTIDLAEEEWISFRNAIREGREI
ncbi:MAG: hypothetical protein OXC11_01255 [Rhodospirillales bacterium]|nr:hypothetical protein [Rhodospirillales bacterium]